MPSPFPKLPNWEFLRPLRKWVNIFTIAYGQGAEGADHTVCLIVKYLFFWTTALWPIPFFLKKEQAQNWVTSTKQTYWVSQKKFWVLLNWAFGDPAPSLGRNTFDIYGKSANAQFGKTHFFSTPCICLTKNPVCMKYYWRRHFKKNAM